MLAAGYLPLVLLLGFGWGLLLSTLQGETSYAMYRNDGNPLHSIANFAWNWHIKLRSVLELPGEAILSSRVAELTRLWNWAVPGLPLLAAAGWWLHRRDRAALLLGLSMASTILGYLLISYTQGYGWGARYLHPAWGALPVLAALALVRAQADTRCQRLPAYVAGLALLSLVLATALRAAQIREYVDQHLARRPPEVAGARQVIFQRTSWRDYSLDLVQNDPFLRGDVLVLLSYGAEADASLIRSRFPQARLASSDERGQVWLLPPR
jgi:hypothetical protein